MAVTNKTRKNIIGWGKKHVIVFTAGRNTENGRGEGQR